MKIITVLKNLIYIGKLFFNKWYRYEYWDKNRGEVAGKFKVSNLEYHQIEGLLYWFKFFRDRKIFIISDYIKNKLIEVGRVFIEPGKGACLGQFKNRLDIKISPDNEVILEGIIHENKDIYKDTDLYFLIK